MLKLNKKAKLQKSENIMLGTLKMGIKHSVGRLWFFLTTSCEDSASCYLVCLRSVPNILSGTASMILANDGQNTF